MSLPNRLSSFILKLRYAPLRWRYRDHRFHATFNWQWANTNYNRIALVNLLLSTKRDAAYLEIGCQSNDLFDSVPSGLKVGVDPVSGGTTRATSDEFFEANGQLFDVIFIDGLHTYNQVRRDVMNSIRFLKPGGFVALHDMLPRSWLEHHVPRINTVWTGDVWKVAFELSQSRAIDFKIVKIDHGVGVFRATGVNPNLADMRKHLQEKQFEHFYNNIDTLPLITWEDFVKWVG